MFTIAGLIEMVIRTITKAPKLTIQHRQVTVVDWYLCIQIWDLSGLGVQSGGGAGYLSVFARATEVVSSLNVLIN